MMAVEYVKGDLFLSGKQTLGHGVNCEGKMGAGIALEFKKRCPGMFEEYRRRCKSGELRPGRYYLEKGLYPWVLNLATQESTKGASMKHVESAFQNLAENWKAEGITSLALPRIAGGLGGLPWKDVKAVINETLDPTSLPVTVYEEYVQGL